jgi:hypothetical protein
VRSCVIATKARFITSQSILVDGGFNIAGAR